MLTSTGTMAAVGIMLLKHQSVLSITQTQTRPQHRIVIHFFMRLGV